MLRVATKFEETIISGRSQEIALGLKEPFVTLGEPHSLSKRQKGGRADSPKDEILETTENEPDDWIETRQVPNLFEEPPGRQRGGRMRHKRPSKN